MGIPKKESVYELKKSMDKAGKNARKRDLEAESYIDNKAREVNQLLSETEKELNEKGFGIYKKRQASTVKHVQFIQSNWKWMKEQSVLSTAEKAFLVDIVDMVQFGSNAICKDSPTGQTACNISEISELLKTDIKHIRKIIKSLFDKGVLCIAESVVDGENPKNPEEPNPAKAKMIFVNPRLMHSGYNDNVNETLKIMFKKSLTKVPVKIF